MDRRQLLVGGAAVATLLPAAMPALAQTEIEADKIPALEGGMFAKMTSDLALQKSQNDNVLAFAQLESTEQEAVMAAFNATGVEVPLREDHAATLAQLEALEGAEFDMAYIDGQIAGHEELRPIHAEYAQNGSDPQARGGSIVGVPSIDTHLVMLRSFRAQMAG